MNVIPVMDVKEGRVVHARRGARDQYQSVRSDLCPGDDPIEVAQALLRYTGARQLYLADLDALQGKGLQTAVLARLRTALPDICLWVDAGIRRPDDLDALLACFAPSPQQLVAVLGSESLSSLEALRGCLARHPACALSLDHRHGQPIDPAACWSSPQDWPERVIAMNLDQVGAESGPDLGLIRQIRSHAPDAHVLGAGGIRDDADLNAAAQAGAHGWLVASALHKRRLPPAS